MHLTASVGWIGAVAVYLALGVAAAISEDARTARAAWIAMELTGWSVIVPLALATLLTGIVMALGTPWGLFRHYWVLIALVLTALATGVLLLRMPTLSRLADRAREADAADLGELGNDLVHPSAGLVVLLVVMVLNMYKPRGTTRYGRRKHLAAQAVEQVRCAAAAPLAPIRRGAWHLWRCCQPFHRLSARAWWRS
ncbi:DUF2269 domain-containing protein [Pseudonocardia nigra]|uniref:DUF2269 domain-containing protein n=1 Tax=Pseudonocardia nigra TaxID=1921578 RepID=UPI001C5CF96D|nr:DUF2269 domain-containing protein [Pseudonocardia nigra]